MQAANLTRRASGDFRTLLWFGYGAIGLTFGVFGAWAAMAPLDSAAVAPAQVAVSTNKKPVQHLEGGILREVLVTESQRVEAGQILFRLQPTQAQANADTLRNQQIGALALKARLVAEREARTSIAWPAELLAERDLPTVATVMAAQEQAFFERRRSQDAQLQLLQGAIVQAQRDIDGKRLSEHTQRQQLDSLTSDFDKRKGLADKGYFPLAKLNELQRDLWQRQGNLALLMTDIEKGGDVIKDAMQKIALTKQQRVDEASQQLVDIQAKLADVREKMAVARDVVSRLEVRAARAGIVQNIKVHTVGEVVRPGDTLAELVTPEEGLILTAQVLPNDIDSVSAGSKVEIRFPAFASRQRFATHGRIETIAADLSADPTGRQSFYAARVAIDEGTLPPDLRGKLIPGMPASVLITTGERTLLTYLVGPLKERIIRTMRDK